MTISKELHIFLLWSVYSSVRHSWLMGHGHGCLVQKQCCPFCEYCLHESVLSVCAFCTVWVEMVVFVDFCWSSSSFVFVNGRLSFFLGSYACLSLIIFCALFWSVMVCFWLACILWASMCNSFINSGAFHSLLVSAVCLKSSNFHTTCSLLTLMISLHPEITAVLEHTSSEELIMLRVISASSLCA